MEPEKITLIRKYLSKQGIKYYDVQAELIDHFATAVENTQDKNPDLSFKEALLQAHRAFGGSKGFWRYEKEAERNVSRKITRLMGQTLLRFFKWPYALLSASLILFWFFLSPYLDHQLQQYIVGGFALLFIVMWCITYFKLRKVAFHLPKRSNWYLGFLAYYLLYLPGFFGVVQSESGFSPIAASLYFAVLSFILIAYYHIPQLTIQETRKMYPQIAS